jgi:predicted protein tyrosine phosphatase
VRSAGFSGKSRREISGDDLDWADLVLVMERRYERRIRAEFRERQYFPPMESLEIPDQYKFMDQELIELIRSGTEHHIRANTEPGQPPDTTPASGTFPAG